MGRRVFSVPRFIGLAVDEADFSIRASGLNTGSVIVRVVGEEKREELVELARELEIDTITIIESGHVYQQRPEIGNDIRLGQQVDIWLISLDKGDRLSVLEDWLKKVEDESPNEEPDEE